MEKEKQIEYGEQLFCNTMLIIATQQKLDYNNQLDVLVAKAILSSSIKLN